jgi:hypothetical protein
MIPIFEAFLDQAPNIASARTQSSQVAAVPAPKLSPAASSLPEATLPLAVIRFNVTF